MVTVAEIKTVDYMSVDLEVVSCHMCIFFNYVTSQDYSIYLTFYHFFFSIL